TWYGMPAYALDGKIVCFFQSGAKFKTRYATFGFNESAKLDDGTMWPTAFALKKLTPADENRLGRLIRKAADGGPLPSSRDAGGARQPRPSATRPRSDRPRVRTAARRRGARSRGADVDRAFLAPVPRRVRGDPLRVPDDETHRAREGSPPPWRQVR